MGKIEAIISWMIFVLTNQIIIKWEIKTNLELFYSLHKKTTDKEIKRKEKKND